MAFDEWKYENERNDYQKRSYLESNANIEVKKKVLKSNGNHIMIIYN